MKSRILLRCSAVVALVLILAAVPLQATERRDPLIVPDAIQTQPAKTPGSSHPATSGKKRSPKSVQKHAGAGGSVAKKNSNSASSGSAAK